MIDTWLRRVLLHLDGAGVLHLAEAGVWHLAEAGDWHLAEVGVCVCVGAGHLARNIANSFCLQLLVPTA